MISLEQPWKFIVARLGFIEHCDQKIADGGNAEEWDIHVRCFLMDLRGSVLWLKDDGTDAAC